nr:gamma-glutamyltransferase [Streptomyces sp. 3211]
MQPQGRLQLITRTVDDHADPQAALGPPPRWCWTGDRQVLLEPPPSHAAVQLEEAGHHITVTEPFPTCWSSRVVGLRDR